MEFVQQAIQRQSRFMDKQIQDGMTAEQIVELRLVVKVMKVVQIPPQPLLHQMLQIQLVFL